MAFANFDLHQPASCWGILVFYQWTTFGRMGPTLIGSWSLFVFRWKLFPNRCTRTNWFLAELQLARAATSTLRPSCFFCNPVTNEPVEIWRMCISEVYYAVYAHKGTESRKSTDNLEDSDDFWCIVRMRTVQSAEVGVPLQHRPPGAVQPLKDIESYEKLVGKFRTMGCHRDHRDHKDICRIM